MTDCLPENLSSQDTPTDNCVLFLILKNVIIFGQTVFNLFVGIRRIKNSSGLIVLKNI